MFCPNNKKSVDGDVVRDICQDKKRMLSSKNKLVNKNRIGGENNGVL